MHIFVLALATVLVALPASLRAEGVTTFELENGLEAVVIEDHRAPVVVHMVWYRVGAADEPPGKSGIAHFLEHLMFKATDELASGEFSDVVFRNGGSDNAFTSYDFTAYVQRIAADRLDLVMGMEASRMDGLALVEEDISTERDVVIEERKQGTDSDPGTLFGEQIYAAAFLNHPYGVPVIGWKHEAEALTLEDAVSFYEQHYGPNSAILVVAGDVDPDEVRVLAERHYGVIPPNPNVRLRSRPSEPPHLAERRLSYSDPRIGNDYMIRVHLVPERDSGEQKEAASLAMLAHVLGGSSTTSALARKLQFEDPKAVYTAAWYREQALDDTIFGLAIMPVEGVSLEVAESLLDGAVAEFLAEGVDAEELERIKTRIRAAEIYARDDISNLANLYGAGLTTGLSVEDIKAWPGILQEVTEEDILSAARRHLDRRRAVTGFARQSEEVVK
ncbi:MAG: insulinase family protein [Boseongicola sp. SB0676_bin_33]|nr:insulinase family protein [Boseongicola sp. SB0676_bin_33]